jgi:PAS domain S-box-containing protein
LHEGAGERNRAGREGFLNGNLDSSARRYVDFINSIPLAVFRTTIEGKIVFCNRAFAKLFGFDNLSELLGYPVINLYRNKKDRGTLVHSIMQRGRINDLPVAFLKQDATPIWCAVTAKAVLDDDGMVVHLDGVMRDITAEIEEKGQPPGLDGFVSTKDDIIFIFDMQGNVIDINEAGTRLLGTGIDTVRGKSLTEFLAPRHHELFLLYLSDILKFGSEQLVLPLRDSAGREHQVDCHAILVKKDDRVHHIKGIAQDITHKMQRQKAKADSEKMQGVLEMAGGVAHRLNQPLTILNNTISDILFDARPEDPKYEKLVLLQNQITKMNEITQKIGNIKKYAAMDYVAGIKIVDIDKAI